MIDKVNSPANIQAMLQTLKQYETEAKSGLNTENVGKSEISQPSFLESVKSAIGSVNDAAQAKSEGEGDYKNDNAHRYSSTQDLFPTDAYFPLFSSFNTFS